MNTSPALPTAHATASTVAAAAPTPNDTATAARKVVKKRKGSSKKPKSEFINHFPSNDEDDYDFDEYYGPKGKKSTATAHRPSSAPPPAQPRHATGAKTPVIPPMSSAPAIPPKIAAPSPQPQSSSSSSSEAGAAASAAAASAAAASAAAAGTTPIIESSETARANADNALEILATLADQINYSDPPASPAAESNVRSSVNTPPPPADSTTWPNVGTATLLEGENNLEGMNYSTWDIPNQPIVQSSCDHKDAGVQISGAAAKTQIGFHGLKELMCEVRGEKSKGNGQKEYHYQIRFRSCSQLGSVPNCNMIINPNQNNKLSYVWLNGTEKDIPFGLTPEVTETVIDLCLQKLKSHNPLIQKINTEKDGEVYIATPQPDKLQVSKVNGDKISSFSVSIKNLEQFISELEKTRTILRYHINIQNIRNDIAEFISSEFDNCTCYNMDYSKGYSITCTYYYKVLSLKYNPLPPVEVAVGDILQVSFRNFFN